MFVSDEASAERELDSDAAIMAKIHAAENDNIFMRYNSSMPLYHVCTDYLSDQVSTHIQLFLCQSFYSCNNCCPAYKRLGAETTDRL